MRVIYQVLCQKVNVFFDGQYLREVSGSENENLFGKSLGT